MSDIEVATSLNNETTNNEQEQEQTDFVYWINSFNLPENSSLNYPFDKWQTFCVFFWIFIFIIICVIILTLLLRK